MRIENRIAEKFGITANQAMQVIQWINENIGLDWSEASYAQIFSACRTASKNMVVQA